MRTTIDLPDELARAAKVLAAQRGETLKEVLTRAVAREVSAASEPARRSRVQLPLVKGTSGKSHALTNEDIADILAEDDIRYAS